MATPSVPSIPPFAPIAAVPESLYELDDTRALVSLVTDAAELIRTDGESAFTELRRADSRWRHGETYVFVLDPDGNMLVHPDPHLEGRNELDLKDVNGKPIVRGLIAVATAHPEKHEGWYHYEWPVPGGLLPRWKSTYVRLVQAPLGKSYVVGAGTYNDRMEKAFVHDLVINAVAALESHGASALDLFRDPTGPFRAKNTYIFIFDLNGIEVLNVEFPYLEGRNLLQMTDTNGKKLVHDMIRTVQKDGAGWVDYMWPKPGDSVSTQKSAFVSAAKMGYRPVLVGCGVYPADARRETAVMKTPTAAETMALVQEAAAILEERGEAAFPDLRKPGSKWFHDDVYLFVWTMDGRRVFHAADPASEGQGVSGMKDMLGRPICRMMLDVAGSPRGEGWVHYMHVRRGTPFPSWKSTFVRRVTFPSGKQHLVGCGVYRMQMDKPLIEDLVERAAALITERGREAFDILRDRKGPFVFMDTYVFVTDMTGTELVNAGQPSLEGVNLIDVRDIRGKLVVPEQIETVERQGHAWLEYYWFKPGDNTPARKLTYVRKVEAANEAFVVGSGIYME